MTQPRSLGWSAGMVLVTAAFLLPLRASAQNGTVTDDGFLSSNSTTQKVNLGGYGPEIVVAGSSATVGTSLVGQTKGFIKFQLQSSLPPGTPALTAADIAKATLKLFISPSCSPMGSVAIYPVTSTWTETTLNPSAPPALAGTPFATGIAVGKPDSFVVVDVTGLVKQWVEGSANGGIDNDGIALVAETATTNVSFDSKDNAITSHEPRLEIVLTNSGPPGTAATITIGSTSTVGPNVSASVSNSGTPNAAILNFSIPQGQAGATGQTGPAGQAATINVAPTMTVPPGTPASVMTSGPSSNPTLTFLIPQGAVGATGSQGPQGPVGINNKGAWSSAASYNATDAVFDSASFWLATTANSNSEPSLTNNNWQLIAGGIVNRGAWTAASNYNVNDAVSDGGSFWLAVVPTSASTASPSTSCEPSQAACAADWQLLAQQGAQGPQGQTGSQGPQGIQGLMGIQGPPGPVPLNVAVTNANNNFTTAQNVGGNVSITGAGNGLVFPDGTVQTTAATALGGGPMACFASNAGPDTCPVVLSSSSTPPPGYWPLNSVTTTPLINPTWSAVAAPGTSADASFGIASANGLLYIVGGDNLTEQQMLSYNPATNKWTHALGCLDNVTKKTVTCNGSPLPVLPTPRSNVVAVAASGPVLSNVYAFGGIDNTRVNHAVSTEVDLYDPNSNTWTKVSDIPAGVTTRGTGPRAYTAGANLNGRIFILGGEVFLAGGLAPVTTVSVYNPSTGAWSSAADMPIAREKFTAAVVNGKLYAIGGLTCPSTGCPTNGPSPTNSVDIYDLQSDTWSTASSHIPFNIENTAAASSINGIIYVILDQSTLVYDPVTDRWTNGAALPATLGNGAGLTTMGNSLYAVGTGLADVFTAAQTTYGYVKVCQTGQVICGTTCSDNTSDVNNCGFCGHICSNNNASPACTNSVCALTCNSGFADCDGNPSNGCESNLSTDPFNCGGCGNFCPVVTAATSTCTASVCGFTCNSGFADCDKNSANGCEVHIAADTNNCGACGHVCPGPGPNQTAVCSAGVCGLQCFTGFADCDGNPANGCEANLNSDPNNCLSCGNVCAAGQVCTPGGCFTPLPSGSACGNNSNCVSGVCTGGVCQ
jgi:Kelch motif/Galactose oxidase, central domain